MVLKLLLYVTVALACRFAIAAVQLHGGVEFFELASYKGRSQKVAVTDGKCQSIPVFASMGTMKMLGAMQCKIFWAANCHESKYEPASKWWEGPYGDASTLDQWLVTSGMSYGDYTRSAPWVPTAFICRSLFNNLLNDDD